MGGAIMVDGQGWLRRPHLLNIIVTALNLDPAGPLLDNWLPGASDRSRRMQLPVRHLRCHSVLKRFIFSINTIFDKEPGTKRNFEVSGSLALLL